MFQGDLLSLLLFCLALAPFSYELYNTRYGYSIYGDKTNHISFMDGLKLYGQIDYELDGLWKIAKKFSDDLRMTFGIDKYTKATFIRERLWEIY